MDAVTPFIQVVWLLSESWCWCEALHYDAEATFCIGSCQVKRVGNASAFFSVCWHMRLSFVPLSITSRRITPSQFLNTMIITFTAGRESVNFFFRRESAWCHIMDCLFVWGSKWWTQVLTVIKRLPPQPQSTLNNLEGMAILSALCWSVRFIGTCFVHTSEYSSSQMMAWLLPSLTDRRNANSWVVMRQSSWIIASAHCNIVTLTAVTGWLEGGTSRSCTFPTSPSLTLFAKLPTVLLLTAAFP